MSEGSTLGIDTVVAVAEEVKGIVERAAQNLRATFREEIGQMESKVSDIERELQEVMDAQSR